MGERLLKAFVAALSIALMLVFCMGGTVLVLTASQFYAMDKFGWSHQVSTAFSVFVFIFVAAFVASLIYAAAGGKDG